MKTILLLIALMVIFWAIAIGWQRQEQYECIRWADEAKDRPNYFYADWQKEQCNLNK